MQEDVGAGGARPGRRQRRVRRRRRHLQGSPASRRPDISILDDKFLQTFKDRPHENLRLKLLEKLLADELTRRAARNLAQAKSFRELLEATLAALPQALIDAAAVVQAMVADSQGHGRRPTSAPRSWASPRRSWPSTTRSRDNDATLYDEPFLRDLVHDVVQVVKGNLR